MAMDRLAAEDQRMLWPAEIWPQDIGALAILDGSHLLEAGGRFRIEAVREVIASGCTRLSNGAAATWTVPPPPAMARPQHHHRQGRRHRRRQHVICSSTISSIWQRTGPHIFGTDPARGHCAARAGRVASHAADPCPKALAADQP